MKLPNRENAQVPKEKLFNYLLSTSHPAGKAKAKFFRKLGFNESNTNTLINEFLKIARANDVFEFRETSHGINYLIKGQIKSPNGRAASIKTVWVVDKLDKSPRLVTAIPVIIISKAKK